MTALAISEIQKRQVIYDCNKKPYTVIMPGSLEKLKNLPDGLNLDRRISLQSKIGLHPDLDHSCYQVFFIKDKTKVIGLTTLFAVPYKELSKQGYLVVKNNIVTLRPITAILAIQNPNSLIVECGFTQLLPAYRAKKLGVAMIKEIIVPTILNLRKKFHGDVFVICSAQGVASQSLYNRIQNFWNQYLKTASDSEISIPMNNLGKISPHARFTEIAAKSFDMKQLENVYQFRFGPVFVKKL